MKIMSTRAAPSRIGTQASKWIAPAFIDMYASPPNDATFAAAAECLE
jgi:hypothetical protein